MDVKIIQQVPGDYGLAAVQLENDDWSILYVPGSPSREYLPVRFDNAVDALAAIYSAPPELLIRQNREHWVKHALACGARATESEA